MARGGTAKRGGTRTGPLDPAQLLTRGTHDHYVDVALYDFEYADQHEDIDFYLRVVADELGAPSSAPPLLELGAGSGRIALPLAHAGYRVLALDRMRSMLDALEAKATRARLSRIEPIEADMRSLPLADGSVPLVIAPFNALMHLYTWRDLLDCFGEVHRVLRPGGAFIFDVLMPDLDWLTWDPNARHGVTRFEHPVSGETMCYSTNHTYDPATQVCHIRIYYDLGPRPKPRSEPYKLVHLAHRQIWPEELRALIATAGFELESHTGDFAGAPIASELESQTLICRKSGG